VPVFRRTPSVAPRRSARIKVTARLLVGRRRERSRPGFVLAVVALLTQIAGPGLHARALIGPANGVGQLAFAFDEHALCLAPNDAAHVPAAPADKAPKANHNFAACCVWHGAAGAVLAPAALVEPVAFAESRVAFTAPPADIPTRLSGAVRARAPPAGA
jgi:hypothetical protein